MPLIRIAAPQAVENRKNNPFSHWGDRGGSNRVEPVAMPDFDVPFKFVAGEAIFTVGSCFARNVETELARRGFRIPAREIFRLPEFVNVERGIINNYGTPSIYNELAWAFGEKEFVFDDHIVEVMPGKFADQHISPTLRPEAKEIVLARRRAISESYRAAAGCRIVIMTLGLSEVWYDKKSACYLNVTPRPATLRNAPDRYELHVLSYEEVLSFLMAALRLLQKHGPEDLRVLLTVSPVPLQATQRPIDVLVANSYSKAVLRTAAETAVAELPFVSYYPSYESVTLTDRKIAWLDDLTHVSDEIVRVNVERMVDAFCRREPGQDREAIEQGGEAVALSRAQAALTLGSANAAAFFEEYGHWSKESARFAAEHARHLLDVGNPAAALALLENHSIEDNLALLTLTCEALLASGRADEALARLDTLGDKRIKSIALWDTLLQSAISTRDPATVVSVLGKVVRNVKGRRHYAFMLVGRFFRDSGNLDEASRYFSLALESGGGNLVVIEQAELLVTMRRPEEARELLADFTAENVREETRLRSLVDVLGLVQRT